MCENCNSNRPVRVRFAPSPTGYLHVGGARTAIYNYFFAKHMGGTFYLRIEDTDRKRYNETALHDLMRDLKWLGPAEVKTLASNIISLIVFGCSKK